MKHAIAWLCLLFHAGLSAQSENAHWVFSFTHAYDFRQSPPAALQGAQTPRQRGMATISDEQGELLFYADDHQVFNRLHQVMPGGESLIGAIGTPFQGSMVLTWPGHRDGYFLITNPALANPEWDTQAYYHVVDMAANDGLGAVVLANQVLADSVCAPLAAVPHATEHAWWIILYHGTQHAFLSFLLDSSGIDTEPVMSSVGTPETSTLTSGNSIGFMRPDPTGDRLIWTKRYEGDGPSVRFLEIFDFDATTGEVANYRRIDGPANLFAAEFSPNGQYLYVSDLTCTDAFVSRLWQYDVSSDDPEQILASKTVVHAAPVGDLLCHGFHSTLATAYDGRIYVGIHGGYHLGVINEPDLPSPDCNYIHEALGNGIDQVSTRLPNQPRAFPMADNTSIAERHAAGPTLHTWPNPASGQLFVQAQGLLPGRSTLRLFAADGRELRRERPAGWPHALDVQGLAPGLYLLRVEGPQGSATRRVVVE
jgi:hypothetical protein